MVLAYFWQPGPSFPLEFVWSWLESVDTTWTDVLHAKCLQNIVSLSFNVHYSVENLQHYLKTKYDVLIFALFNVQEDEVVYLCLLLDVINLIKRVFLTTSNESFWMELIRSSSNQRSTIWSSRTSQRSKMRITDLVRRHCCRFSTL